MYPKCTSSNALLNNLQAKMKANEESASSSHNHCILEHKELSTVAHEHPLSSGATRRVVYAAAANSVAS